MKKLVEELNFNPKTCEDITNYIKEKNQAIPQMEALDFTNPDDIKRFY